MSDDAAQGAAPDPSEPEASPVPAGGGAESSPAGTATEAGPAVDPVTGAEILDHNYDGIQEYDNPLPGWWSFIFWATIIFTPLYVAYYHWGPGLLVFEEYEQDRAARAGAAPSGESGPSEEALAALAADEAKMKQAAELFAQKCVACHGPQGQGLIGPNLCDDYFLHGPTRLDAYRTIRDGVPAKGMIAWGKQLSPEQLQLLAAYVSSLRGSNPPNPKAPQGTKAP
ncbi:MAG: hypothetical protein D6731_13330 [Planctomycetota bacterium]|nr:MAG: hypothetical protein D6731_13330 [Planctomycetota bacterium]